MTLLIFLSLLFLLLNLSAQAQQPPDRPIVKLIYFVPSDIEIDEGGVPVIGQGYEERIRDLMVKTQSLYEQEMKRHGFVDANGNGKTFLLEHDQEGAIVVHKIDGKLKWSEYQEPKNTRKIDEELFFDDGARFSRKTKDIYLIFVETDTRFKEAGDTEEEEGDICGLGIALNHNTDSTYYTLQGPLGLFGIATFPFNDLCFDDDEQSSKYKYNTPIQHELGHTFGLQHDWRDDEYVMSYGVDVVDNRVIVVGTKLSACAAEWLNHHRAFNQNQGVLNGNTAFFKKGTQVGVSDPDGIGAVQVIKHDVQITKQVSDVSLVGCESSRLAGNVGILFDPTTFSATIAESTVKITQDDVITFRVIDGYGNITLLRYVTLRTLPCVSASVASPLTETTLDGTTVSLTLANAIYDPDILKIILALEVSGIDGVRIDTSEFQRLSDTEVTFELSFDGTDFDKNGILTFSVAARAIVNYTVGAFTAEIPVTASRDESLMKIVWVSTAWMDKIQCANLDGTDIETLVTSTQGLASPQGIALDVAGGKMYWTDTITVKIQRANLDGSDVQDLVTQGLIGPPYGIALDVAGGKMYWTDFGPSKIQRANLDGTDVETLVTSTQGLVGPRGIALDVAGGKMYWTDFSTDKIQRANLDGTDVETLVTSTQGLVGPHGIALDVAGGKMYWTDVITDKIQRANLDGTDVEDLVTQGLVGPYGIALDVANSKMYLSDNGIHRVNLDGTDVEDLVTHRQGLIGSPRGIAIGITPVHPTTAKEDVNGDGVVDVKDLAEVADVLVAAKKLTVSHTDSHYDVDKDVDGDNDVDLDDMLAIANEICEAAAAPSAHLTEIETIQHWLAEAKRMGNIDPDFLQSIEMLEQLLDILTPIIPMETALLANYPNPFNPETWIPYQLAKSADVSITIYAANGTLIRTLNLGHQAVGVYQHRNRAAHWNGKNVLGEAVASGVYFYTFKAGDFSATRKMLILK